MKRFVKVPLIWCLVSFVRGFGQRSLSINARHVFILSLCSFFSSSSCFCLYHHSCYCFVSAFFVSIIFLFTRFFGNIFIHFVENCIMEKNFFSPSLFSWDVHCEPQLSWHHINLAPDILLNENQVEMSLAHSHQEKSNQMLSLSQKKNAAFNLLTL